VERNEDNRVDIAVKCLTEQDAALPNIQVTGPTSNVDPLARRPVPEPQEHLDRVSSQLHVMHPPSCHPITPYSQYSCLMGLKTTKLRSPKGL